MIRSLQKGMLPLVTLALAMLLAPALRAQQELMMSQYMFNGLVLNPAYAGSHPWTSASLLHRAQWVGMEGAPRTSIGAIDGPLDDGRMGLGFTLMHDQIGVSRDMEAAADYAYRIRVGKAGRLSFGLKAGISLYSAKLSDLVYWDAQDALYQQDISNATVGRFGFGMYWYNDRSFIGLSVPTLYAADGNVIPRIEGAPDHFFTRHWYLHAGHVFEIDEHFDIKPSVLVKYQEQAPPEVDINCNVLFKKRFWLGAGYRTGDAMTAMVEYQMSPMFRLGYAYDLTLSELRRYGGGSHEVMLSIDLGHEPIKIKTPRYF